MALPGATQPSPQVVGAAFVQQYYYVLYQSPDQVHKFYQESSILTRPDSRGSMTSVTSLPAINDKLLSLDFSNYTAEIESADSQASYKDSVLVLVTGSLTGKDNIRCKFTQSFFLAPQERGGYVVLNDIFRFVDLSQSKDVNQVILNDTNDDASAAPSTPDPEPILVEEPYVANGVNHEAAVEDTSNGQELSNHQENGILAAMDGVVADPEVQLSQSDEQTVSESTASVSQEDGPKKSYASIVMVYKDVSPVLASMPVSKPKAPLPKADDEKTQKTNAEKQTIPHLKTSSTLEAPIPASNNVPESNSIDVEGHSIYIRNLPLSTTPDQVEEEFGKFGPIRPGGVQVRNHKVERFCFGFVEFESLDSMHAAIKASPITFGGRQAYVEEKRTTTRVVNGVVTNNGGGGGKGWYQAGRGSYRTDNFRGRGGFGGNQSYGRAEFRTRVDYLGRGRGGPPRPGSGYQLRPFQNGYGQMYRPDMANQTAISA